MSEKTYYDSDDKKCTLYQLVCREPKWAVSRINKVEQLEVENRVLKKQHTRIFKEKYPEQILSLQKKLIAIKERDWEKCCQEFKETLIAENKALKKRKKELLDALRRSSMCIQTQAESLKAKDMLL